MRLDDVVAKTQIVQVKLAIHEISEKSLLHLIMISSGLIEMNMYRFSCRDCDEKR